MKKSLYEKLVSEISRIDARCEQLNKNWKEYKEDNDFENALKTDIKWRQLKMVSQSLKKLLVQHYTQRIVYGQFIYGFKNENKMSKDLEILKDDVKKLMLKDWTKTEVENLSEFMEDVIIATMVVNKLPIHVVVKSF